MNNKLSKPLSVFLTCFACALSHAQDDYSKHQLFAGYGLGHTNEVFTDLGSAFNINFLQAVFSDSADQNTVMPVYIGYRYFLRKHLGLGINLAYPLMNIEANNQSNIQSKSSQKQQLQAIIFLPRFDVVYVNKKVFQLYSGLGMGMIVENIVAVEGQEASIAPAYQITAIGFSFGKTVGLFTELGYGVNGIFSIGIATKLDGEDLQKENDQDKKGAKKKASEQPCIRL